MDFMAFQHRQQTGPPLPILSEPRPQIHYRLPLAGSRGGRVGQMRAMIRLCMRLFCYTRFPAGVSCDLATQCRVVVPRSGERGMTTPRDAGRT